MSPSSDGLLRRLRFFLLEKLVLPLAIVPLKLWFRSWRSSGYGPGSGFDRLLDTPRVLLVTYHGMFLHLLGLHRTIRHRGRRFVVILSPSLDGRLLAACLGRFGITHVWGTSGSRGSAGALEFIRRVKAGDIGVIAVDGPLGPCCVAKSGFLKVAAAAGAALGVTASSASAGITFGSWDRSHLAAPFAHVEVSTRVLPPPSPGIDVEEALPDVEAALLGAARGIASPVLPPELRGDVSPLSKLREGPSGHRRNLDN